MMHPQRRSQSTLSMMVAERSSLKRRPLLVVHAANFRMHLPIQRLRGCTLKNAVVNSKISPVRWMSAAGQYTKSRIRAQVLVGYILRLHVSMIVCITDKSSYGESWGCMKDASSKRLLRGFKYDLTQTNTPERCLQHCLRIGAQLAGTLNKLCSILSYYML